MITLTTVSYIHEADILCMKLEAEGIKTFIPDQNLVTVQPFFANAMCGIRVQVNESDLPLAREILQREYPAACRNPLECPKCKAAAGVPVKISALFVVASLLLIGIPFLWFRRQCQCPSCGNVWKMR
jgi:hypothetical protein